MRTRWFPQYGITFDKSKIECFNCQKLGHFARECRFAKYQENKANGRNEKRIVAIEDSNSKALVATDNNEDIDWTKEFDAEPVTYAMMALTGVEQDDWSIEFDAEHMHFGQDGLGDFDWSNKADDAPISLALMATNSEGPRDTRPVWNNIQRVNHSNFSRNSRYPHQRKSFIPSAVLTREGLKSTARPEVPHAVLSQSTGRPYHPRMDNIRPRTSSFSPSSRSSTTRTPHRPQRPKKIVKSIWVKKGSTVGSQAVLPQTVKKNAMINPKQTWRPKGNYLDSVNRDNGSYTLKQFEYGNPEEDLKDYAIIDSGCSGSMTGDKDKLSDFKEFKGGYVAFGNDSKGGRISGKGTIKTSCLDFEKVSYVEELKFNLLSVSQICDKKHNVLFTDKECLILSPKFKFVDEDLVILRAPRKNDVYSLDLKNIIPSGGITCLVAKATEDEAVLWHRRLGHVNFKNINKLVKGNLVRGLPSKTFKLDHSCVACRKGKQHRASCKKIEERTVREPLELLHMDLFGPVSVESVNRKKYCLVVTDDCSKFSWVFFLAYKDETYDMLHDLIVGLENRLRHKVKTIRCDHGTEFKNQLMNEFCAKKGIKREYSIARTPQQNGVAERKNRTLIEAARTMLADSLLPIQFWAEAVNTACYVLNRVLVTKPQMKTPYEILMGRSPNISFMRPFGCSLTILNTLDHLGKFDGKSEEGYLLGYSTNSKGFRVYNRVTRKVQDCLHVNFLENQENQKGKGPDWMFDLDLLTPSMNYIPVRKENYADSKEQGISCDDVEDMDDQQFIVHTTQPMPPEERTAAKEVKLSSEEQALHDELISLMHQESLAKAHNDDQRIAFEEEKRRISIAKGKEHVDSTFTLSTANTPPQSTGNTPTDSDDDTPTDGVFSTNSFDAEEGGVADYNNMDPTIDVPSTPTLRIHKIHPQSQIIGKSTAGVQTRRKLQDSTSNQHQALLSFIYKQNRTNHKDQQTCLFACFLSQEEPKKVSQALADESWVEAMQEELSESNYCKSTAGVLIERKLKESDSVQHQALLSFIYKQNRTNHKDQQTCLFACFLSQEEPKKVSQALADESWVEAMQEELLQFKLQDVWVLCDLPDGKRVIGTKWVFRKNKRDEMGYYYQTISTTRWDVKSAFFYWQHQRRSVCQTASRFEDPSKYKQVYVDDIIIGSTKSSMGRILKDLSKGIQDERLCWGLSVKTDKTLGGCQYLGRRLVSWQCKKQTIMAISSTEAKYVVAASLCAKSWVDPDLIGPWLQQFWATASLRVINEVPHIRATVAGKKVLISEATIRADLLFDDTDGVDCFPKQVLWDSLRDIGYEVTLPYMVFTFMRKNSPMFIRKITQFDSTMLEVITALAAEEAHSESTHSQAAISPRDAQGTPSQSAAQDSSLQGTVASQGTASLQGDEGLFDLYALNREVRRLKKQTLSQAKQIHKLKAKLKKLSKFVQPVVKHHALWVESQNLKKRRKRQRKKHKKKVSSVKVGRNKDEGTLSEEHYVQEDYTADVFFEDIVDRNAAVTPELERKSDETEEINVEEKEASNVKSGDIEELDLENHQVLLDKDKKKKLTLQQIRALETTNDEEVARKIQAEWDAEEERKRLEELKKAKSKTILKKPTSLAQERNQMMKLLLKGQGYKEFLKSLDFEHNVQDKESLEAISVITEFKVIDSPDGELSLIAGQIFILEHSNTFVGDNAYLG
ncbi:putative ribonuclease H-like domain-containing protein [Tanacetum coccineum]